MKQVRQQPKPRRRVRKHASTKVHGGGKPVDTTQVDTLIAKIDKVLKEAK